MSQEYRYQIVDEERRFDWRDSEAFDRIEFALKVLDILRPNMNITVYERRRNLKVQRGRDWAHGPDAVWAMIGIPKDASRVHVVHAIAELAGVSHLPYIVDLIASVRATAQD